ncbi:MAG: glycosyltransferase family 39 protein [Acidobacteriota bacterium]
MPESAKGDLSLNRSEVWLLAGLFCVALLIRLPNLLLVPRFEDEGIEVLWALEIAKGHILPLSGSDAYYGPLFSYLVAGTFKVLGPNILWPRLLAAVAGSLTVCVTYLLGRIVGGRHAGIVAAGLVLTSPMFVLFGSHFGWSNSLTPLLATAAILALVVAFAQAQVGWAATGGLLTGLMVQSHPLSAVLVAGVIVWIVGRGPSRAWASHRVILAWGAGSALGYLPMLLMFAVRWTSVASEVRNQSYAFNPANSIIDYLSRLPVLGTMLVQMVAGVGSQMWEAFKTARLLTLIAEVLAATSLAWALGSAALSRWARQRPGLGFLACVIAVSVVLLPLIVRLPQMRYLLPLLPAICVLAGALSAHLWRNDVHEARGRRVVWLWRSGVAAVVSVMVATNVFGIVRRTTQLLAEGETNAPFLAMTEVVKRGQGCATGVLVEDTDALGWSRTDGGMVHFNTESVRYVLAMAPCPVLLRSAAQIEAAVAERDDVTWVVASTSTASALSATLDLTPVQPITPGPAVTPGRELQLYRARRR